MKELLYDFYGYNVSIFYIINQYCYNHKLLVIFSYISKIFDIENFAIYYIVSIIVGYLIFAKQKPNSTYNLSKWYDFMIKLGIAYGCLGIICAALKFSINMPRPFCSLPLDSFVTIIDIKTERCLSTFPSFHTALSTILVLIIWSHVKLKGKSLGLVTVIMVAISRICLAMHYPADILYSIFIAYFIYMLSQLIYIMFKNNIIKWIKDRIVHIS